jgi:glucose-1-phosphate thymidylyltransferase
MKALVLSGGAGTWLRSFSHSMLRQLGPVADRPALPRCVDTIRDTGITAVGVIIVWQNTDAVARHRSVAGDEVARCASL